MNKLIKNAFYVCAIALIGCTNKDSGNIELENYEGDWALQVINSEFSIADVLNEIGDNAYIDVSGDTIRLVYTGGYDPL